MGHITNGQFEAISAIERSCSILSLLGCLFIIITFCASTSFHKPINRLVFYASFGNLFTIVGTLMSRSYLKDLDSFGCQLQASLIQLFMPADAFWTLTMAINVYLTFYQKFDAARLRKMEVPYLIGCYGVPAIPAVAFLFIRNEHGQRVYGNATIWCWIDQNWDVLRIASFYAPVWVTIFITFFIYLRAGRTIYERRKQLREFQSSDPDPLSVNDDCATIRNTEVTTEVTITSELAAADEIHLGQISPKGTMAGADADSRRQTGGGAYSVHISADSQASKSGQDDIITPSQGATFQQRASNIIPRKAANVARRRNHEINNAAWSYTKVAFLFFTAIIITWLPSSANRVYSLVHDKETSLPLEFMSAFVLPLQGFWNAIIYATTSWSACKNLYNEIKSGKTATLPPTNPAMNRLENNYSRIHYRSRLGSLFRSPAEDSDAFDVEAFDSESTMELSKP